MPWNNRVTIEIIVYREARQTLPWRATGDAAGRQARFASKPMTIYHEVPPN